MMCANIDPVIYEGKTITKLFVYIKFYDLQSKKCNLLYKAYNDVDGAYYVDHWQVPEEVLNNWGIDDSIIVYALAEEKNLTITDIEI